MAKRDKESKEGAEPKEKKSKKKLIMVVVVILVVGLGAKMTVLAPKAKAACAVPGSVVSGPTSATAATTKPPPTPATTAKPAAAKVATTTTTVCEPAAPLPGSVLKLDSTTINLADGRYLKVGIGLQLAVGVDLKVFTSDDGGAKALDLAIRLLGGKGYNDLLSVKNRNAVQTTLSAQVATAYENKVIGVYFTEFVMQ